MNILFASRKFDKVFGGVERMSIALMNELVGRGHRVSLLSWDESDDAQPFYTLDPRIQWYKIALGDPANKAGWSLRWRRAGKVREIIRTVKPDVMLGFQQGVFLALRLFTFGLGIPTIAAERNAPDRMEFLREGKRRHLIWLSFILAARITIQCESYRSRYPRYLRTRIVNIPNPVFPAASQADSGGENTPEKTLLSVGRLSYQKNYQTLLHAFSTLTTEFPQWRLLIAGDGEDRPQIEAAITHLNLTGRVILLGVVRNVELLYNKAQLFCLPSRWEGFPNALAEAMAHGLPAVGFAGCAGVRDLITDGQTGYLAAGNGDAASLANALRRLMLDNDARRRMGEAARRAMTAFTPEIIFNQWEKLFLSVAGL